MAESINGEEKRILFSNFVNSKSRKLAKRELEKKRTLLSYIYKKLENREISDEVSQDLIERLESEIENIVDESLNEFVIEKTHDELEQIHQLHVDPYEIPERTDEILTLERGFERVNHIDRYEVPRRNNP